MFINDAVKRCEGFDFISINTIKFSLKYVLGKVSLGFILYIPIIFFACKSDSGTLVNNTVSPMCVAIATMPEVDSLSAPQFRGGQGTAHWDLVTDNDTIQLWFDQGLNMLHGFWHIEAFRSFKEIVKIDSTHAMAWWGIAMCQPGFGGDYHLQFVEASQKAVKYSKGLPDVQRDLINATSILLTKGIESAQNSFRVLHKKHSDNVDIVAISAIILRMHVNEDSQQEVKKMLEEYMVKYPDHTGLLHYYIHVMETRPYGYKLAIDEAERLLALAPKSPHMVHMAGHLYFLAGKYERALEVFHRCLDIENEWHASENIPRVHNQNYMHNLHFMALCYSELDEKEKALQYAETYEKTTYRIGQPRSGGTMMLLYEGRILPALVHIRHGEYAQAASRLHYWLHSLDFPLEHPVVRSYLQAMYHYAEGMDAVMKGNKEEAIRVGGEMTKSFIQFEKQAFERLNDIEFKTINETHDIINMSRFELAGWIDNMDKTTPYNGAAWKEAISLQESIKYDEPPRLMYPIEESLMHLHLKRGDKQAAKVNQGIALKKRPMSKVIAKVNVLIG